LKSPPYLPDLRGRAEKHTFYTFSQLALPDLLPLAGFPKLTRFSSCRKVTNMNALTVMQSTSPLGPTRTVPNPILIKIELLGDVCLLHFKGRLYAGVHLDYLNAKLEEIKTLACTRFLANFEDLTLLDCSGLSFIIGLYKASGGRLVLVKTQPRVREVLDITRLSTVIPLAADIESGLAVLGGGASAARGAA
jgi:anti-anti-sigma factor